MSLRKFAFVSLALITLTSLSACSSFKSSVCGTGKSNSPYSTIKKGKKSDHRWASKKKSKSFVGKKKISKKYNKKSKKRSGRRA